MLIELTKIPSFTLISWVMKENDFAQGFIIRAAVVLLWIYLYNLFNNLNIMSLPWDYVIGNVIMQK